MVVSKAREAAYKFAEDSVNHEKVSADFAATHIENLLFELSQYQKVVDAAKEYMSVHDESKNKQLEENLLVALVELNE